MNIQETIKKYLSDKVTEKITKATGLTMSQVQSIINKVLPMFSGALAKNALGSVEGKESLFKAIKDDHDGSVFDKLDDVVNNPTSLKGDKIISHVFGADEDSVEEEIAKEAGVSKEQSKKVLQMIAPLAMGALGKEQSDKGLGLDDMIGMMGGMSKDENLLSKGMKIFKLFKKS